MEIHIRNNDNYQVFQQLQCLDEHNFLFYFFQLTLQMVYYKHQKRVGKFRGIIATMEHSGFPITMTLGFVILVFAISSLLPQLQQIVNEAMTSVSLFGSEVTYPADASLVWTGEEYGVAWRSQ